MWLYWWTPLRHTRYSLRKLTKQKKEKHKACVRVDDNNIERTNQSVMHNWRAQIRAAHQTRTSNKRPSTHRWLLCMTQVAVMHWYRMSVWPWSAVWSHLWSYKQDNEWGWTVRTCPRMRWKFEMAKSQPPISGCNSYKCKECKSSEKKWTLLWTIKTDCSCVEILMCRADFDILFMCGEQFTGTPPVVPLR